MNTTTSLPSFSARSAGNSAFLRTCSVDNKLDLQDFVLKMTWHTLHLPQWGKVGMGASLLVGYTKIAPSLILPRGKKGKLEAYTTSLPSFSARSTGNPAFLRTCSVDNKLDLRAKLEDDSRLEVEFIN